MTTPDFSWLYNYRIHTLVPMFLRSTQRVQTYGGRLAASFERVQEKQAKQRDFRQKNMKRQTRDMSVILAVRCVAFEAIQVLPSYIASRQEKVQSSQ